MNLKKNHKIYVPYLLTCIFTVMLFYALNAISKNNGLAEIRGGRSLPVVMGWVTVVAGGFALIFLFYTNSFLIKQRKKELGLYQVLGMDKKNLSVMMLWETLITAVASLGAGLLLGLALGKLMFLILLKIIHFPVTLGFTIEPEALFQTVELFLAAFALNLVYNLVQVRRGRLSEMVGASRAGEKEPKGKWLITLIGLVALLCYGASFLLSWLPCRLLTGCGYMEALRYSNQLAAKKRGSLFLAVFLPVAACLALDLLIVGLSSMGNLNIPVVLTVELLVLLLFLYYASLMFVAYFALTGEERMDLPRQRNN